MTITDSPRALLIEGTGVTERRIEAAGMATAVLECGSGDDIVLLHGPGEFAASWFEVLPAIAATHHVVAPDLPGHGESAIAADLDARDVLEWLGDVIAATCSAPPIVVGRTLGGAIALRYCAEHADRIRRLVLVDAVGLVPFEPAPPFGAALERYLAEPTAGSFERLMRYCAYDFDSLRLRLGDRFTALSEYAVDRLRAGAALSATGALMEQFGFAAIPAAELARIAVPTAMIWGRHDMATALRVAEDASRAYGWPLHVVDDAADDPALDQPEAFVAALHDALAHGVAR